MFEIESHLQKFAQISKNSEEYQGHGWGLAYLDENNEWVHYKDIKPVWKDNLCQFGSTKLLVVHARSAFEDKDIVVENNMPFYDDNYIFIFNGELQKVRIREEGRIGAEKIFNYIKRFDSGDLAIALEKGVNSIKKRTKYYKAINVIIVDKNNIFLSTNYNERPHYFTMHVKENPLMICSMPYPGETGWEKIPNNTVRVW